MSSIHPKVGIIGGTGWPSTNVYLEKIPRRVQERLGGLNTPDIVFQSRNFAQIDAWMHEGNWQAVTDLLTEMAVEMKQGSHIDSLAVLSNTLHKVAPEAAKVAGVPLIHIGDCTAEVVHEQGIDRVGFIGTKFTMQEDFILQYFREREIKVCTPLPSAMDRIDTIIFDELCKDKFVDTSRDFLFQQVAKMIEKHQIKAVVLGCTELGLTMSDDEWVKFCSRNTAALKKIWGHTALPFIDAAECHIEAIVNYLCSRVR